MFSLGIRYTVYITIKCIFTLYNVRYTLYSVHRIVHNVHVIFTLNIIHYTVYSVQHVFIYVGEFSSYTLNI